MTRTFLIGVGFAILLAGCTSSIMRPISRDVQKVDAEATQMNDHLRKGDPAIAQDSPSVKYVDNVWLPVSKVDQETDPVMNANLNRNVVVNRHFTSMDEAAAYITSLTGLPVLVSLPTTSTSVISTTDPALTYSGKLSGLFDLIAARYGVFWEWDGNGVRVFKTKTRTFRLAALPGDTSMSSKIAGSSAGISGGASGSSSGSSGSSGSSSGDNEQKAGVEFSSLSVWKAVEDGVKTMLSTDGKLTVTPATGTVTVDDTPVVLDRVAQFIDEQNTALSRQVVINVKVLSVNLSKSHEYGINWDMVYNNVNKSIGVDLGSAFTSNVNSSSLTFRLLSGSLWNGSSAIINALSTQGKVSEVTSASLVTLNNQPAPIRVGTMTSYLASSTTTMGTGGAGNTVSLEPGQITTGFSMNVLPHILDNKKLMLQYSGDISSLTDIDSVSSGGSTIQTPIVDTRNFLQRVILNSGETLVVTGFEQFNLSGQTQGVGYAENIAPGGGATAEKEKTVLVVLIQPVVTVRR